MKISDMKVECVDLKTLVPDAKNTRVHGKRNLDAIKKSLKK